LGTHPINLSNYTKKMPSREIYSDGVRHVVELGLAAGKTPQGIVEDLGVGLSWAYKLKNQFDAFGTVSAPPMIVQGRPRKIHREAQEAVVEFLEQNPSAYQDEIVDFLAEEFEIFVHRTTVCRLLKDVDITHKKIGRAYTDRDDIVRAHWKDHKRSSCGQAQAAAFVCVKP
jgi:transposase